MKLSKGIVATIAFWTLLACQPEPRFELLSPEETGIGFVNRLEETHQLNAFTYLYFYNGGGVAAGDLDGNGLPDLYYTANMDSNRLYLNQGNFRFVDATAEAGLAGKKGWTTGVAIADVNGDGRLDIYVSQLGDHKSIQGRNQLYINLGNDENGTPQFEDQASRWGLDLKGFSTQAAFFDYDLDGDLDMYMLNHSVHSNGTYVKADLRQEAHPLAGDKLMMNAGDHFINVTMKAGIHSSALGYGLGIAISDIDWDGDPDIYVGNDFHENDYLYINNGDGTFTESLQDMIEHTSRYSMGNDIGDINNDGLPDIISLDMLPNDPAKLKASAGEDPFDIYHFKLKYGYGHQLSRNTLQLNLGNGKFSEIALLAGVYATDWSWAPLLADFDLDGFRDIFVSNGIKRRMNDLDFINFVSNEAIQKRLSGELTDAELAMVNEMPVVRIPNFIFRNAGNLVFEDVSYDWGIAQESFSNGAVYADLDNDGDLDLAVNNLDQTAFIYRNNTIKHGYGEQNYLKIKLAGKKPNSFGTGAKAICKAGSATIIQEMFPVRGFQSSVDHEMIIGLGKNSSIDSLFVIWPDLTFETLTGVAANQTLVLHQENANGRYVFKKENEPIFRETEQGAPSFKHEENSFVEFNREPLIPHMNSAEGPGIATGDFDGNGKSDFWIAGAKRQSSAIFLQTDTGFYNHPQEAFRQDSLAEDIAAESIDFDNDGDLDLIVAAGGNEFQKEELPLKVRAYANDGRANFVRDEKALPEIYLTAGCIRKGDYDQDGFDDLFIGGSVVPWQYGENPRNYLLRNQGDGAFQDVTESMPDLLYVGMTKDAEWADLDGNGYPDLILSGEWMPVAVFYNEKGMLSRNKSSGMEDLKGWWRNVEIADVNNDGRPDIIAGNLGLNSKLNASEKKPIELYCNDFDGNGIREHLLVYRKNGRKHLFATRDELAKQLPSLKRKFLKYADYARADLYDIFPWKLFSKAMKLEATEFRSGIFINEGMRFSFEPFPVEAQFSMVRALHVLDFNQDGHPDILGAGNFYQVNTQFGRYDAGFGFLLENNGKGSFGWVPNHISGLCLEGQVSDIKPIETDEGMVMLVGRNNDAMLMLQLRKLAKKLLVNKSKFRYEKDGS